jgi:hypothetical protein
MHSPRLEGPRLTISRQIASWPVVNALNPVTFDLSVIAGAARRGVLDLSSYTFVTVHGLVGAACLLQGYHDEGTPLEFTPPISEDVGRYLSRMRLGSIVDETCGWPLGSLDLPAVRAHPRDDVLVELRRFYSERDLEGLGDLLWQRLEGKIDSGSLNALFNSLLELGANVVQHSECESGFVAAQSYGVGTGDERIDLALGDAGVGIPATMTRYQPPTDLDAVELAMQRDYSGTGEPGRGQGLAEVLDLASALGGNLQCHSGRGRRFANRHRATSTVASQLPGTLVSVRIPCRPGMG